MVAIVPRRPTADSRTIYCDGPSKPRRILVYPPVYVRVAAKSLLVLTHGAVILATLAFAELHAYVVSSNRLRNDVQQLGASIVPLVPFVQAACYVAALAHAVPFVFRAVRLVWRVLSSQAKRPIAASNPPSAHNRWLVAMKRCVARAGRFLSHWSSEIAELRVLVEVAMQTYQAHKMSGLVATVWLNRVLACVIILNCWFTPIVFLTMHKRSLYLKRVVRLSIDTLLDVVYGVGIPVAILYPSYRDFVPATEAFPFDYYVTDTWPTITRAELQQIFVTSWVDLVSKISPWLFMSYRLEVLCSLVSSRRRSVDACTSPLSLPTGPRSMNTRRLTSVLNTVLFAWGVAVLAFHVHVTVRAASHERHGCLVEMRPWLATGYTCPVVEVSCSQREIAGDDQELTLALLESNPQAIQVLILSHCPRVFMPPTLQSLTRIMTLKVYNSTIVQWGDDAALTARTHPMLYQVFLLRTNFTSSLPDGLVSSDMSSTLRDVKLIATNLTTLPLKLAHAWRHVTYFVMELNPLLEYVPDAVSRLPNVMYMSLCSNALERLPENFLPLMATGEIALVNNPLTELPEAIGTAANTLRIIISHTKVASLPAAWRVTKAESESKPVRGDGMVVYAAHTPLCEMLQTTTDTHDEVPTARDGRVTLSCEDRHGNLSNITYPLDKEQTWREVNRS